MNLFEKIKNLFFKPRFKALPEESLEIEKITLLAIKEKILQMY